MAYTEQESRSDGGTSYVVRWRLGGSRSGRKQRETFGAGTDARNKARAEGIRDMVVAAGEFWPDGWVKGRARYKGQLSTLKAVEVRGKRGTCRPFDQRIDLVTEDDVKAWLIAWPRSLKTKANYHGLLFGVFTYAAERGEVAKHPLTRTAPKRSKIRQSQADLRFLTEAEFATVARSAGDAADLLRVSVGTGLRFGELTALRVSDVDLRHRTVRVNKAWKRDGEDGAQDVPGWLTRLVRFKHRMRGHHLGNPKTPQSKRTVEVSPEVAAVLARVVAGEAADDFVFVSPTGLPIHQAEFYERVWTPLMGAVGARSRTVPQPRSKAHARVMAGRRRPAVAEHPGASRPRVDHDDHRHLRPPDAGRQRLASQLIDTALRGEEIHPAPAMTLLPSGKTAQESEALVESRRHLQQPSGPSIPRSADLN